MSPKNVPGIGSTKVATPRQILASLQGALFLPGGKIISGANARDPANTGYLHTLRAGCVLGKRDNDGKYAPSILGRLTVAGTAAGLTITVAAAVGDEVYRRILAGVDVFKVVGPPTDGGVVASVTVGYTTEAAGVITLGANVAVGEIQTSTIIGDLLTAGTFRLGYKGEWTADIAFGATVTQIEAALELLSTVSAGDITLEVAHDPATEKVATWTFADTLGNVPMIQVDFSKATGPTSWTFVESTPGELVGAATLGVDMAVGSLVMPGDGSESPLVLLAEEYGIRVTDEDAANLDVQAAKLLIGGIVKADQIIEYPLEESTRAWLKAQLNAATGGRFTFDDDF